MEQIDLGKEISSTSLKYPVFRGNCSPLITSIERDAPLEPSSLVAFSIHNMTHMDLPWCLENKIEELKSINPRIGSLPDISEIDNVIKRYANIMQFDTIIIDISMKRKFLEGYLDRETGFIRRDITSDSFDELMARLEITERDLMGQISNLKEKFVIFHTGYDLFWRRATNFSNPYFELRHPYLVHPYMLSENLLSKLIYDLDIEGIGSDTYGLESPLHFIHRHIIPNYAKNFYNTFRTSRLPYRPVLTKLMLKNKIYIKNLKNIDQIRNIYANDKWAKGVTTIIPFALGNRDANLIRVFFKGGQI